MRRELQNGAELDHGLGQVDEVAASVFEENGDDRGYFWFAAESDPESIEAVVLGMDVVGRALSWFSTITLARRISMGSSSMIWNGELGSGDSIWTMKDAIILEREVMK